MPTAPTAIGLGSEKYAVYIENASREIAGYRIQSIDPSISIATDIDHELGSVDPTGSSTDAPEYRVTIEQNLIDSKTELVLAGLAANATSITLAQLFSDNDIIIYEPVKNAAGSIFQEQKYSGLALADASWLMSAAGIITQSFTLQGTTLTNLTSGMHSWPAADTSSASSIRGKEAIFYLGGSMVAADTIFRVQTFSIRASSPITVIRELGNRSLVGQIVGQPTVTIGFDVLETESQQPETLLTTSLDYSQPATITGAIKIFAPTQSRSALGSEAGTNALKSFKFENLKMTGATISRATVRGQGTKRFDLMVTAATTAASAGMTVYVGNIS